jgi:hypothetical protein
MGSISWHVERKLNQGGCVLRHNFAGAHAMRLDIEKMSQKRVVISGGRLSAFQLPNDKNSRAP